MNLPAPDDARPSDKAIGGPASRRNPPQLAQPIDPPAEAQAFWRMRVRTVTAALRDLLETSRLRVSLLVLLSGVFWAGLFGLFYEGFYFLNTSIGDVTTHAETVRAIYNVFFVSLMLMLLISSAIILYSGLFCSPETRFLLTIPASPERIVLHKFQEAIFYSSWGFLLLGSPMLIAYGVETRAPWYYFLLILPFMLAFVYIPGGLGAVLCLLVVRRLPRVRIHMTFVAGAAVFVGVLLAWTVLRGARSDLLTPLWFREMLGRLQFSEHRLLPSWWLSCGLLEAARSDDESLDYRPWAESLMYLSLLISNALMCHLWMVYAAARHYRVAFSELAGDRPAHKPRPGFWFDRFILHGLVVLKPAVRCLIVKDLRIFRRNPVQWSQFLIFFALLSLYFVNIRRFSYDVNYKGWVNMISFLNLAVVGLILSTFTTRFIFPMVSLEGRRFWILGLLPIDRDAILWSKFLFAAAGAAIPCTLLILLSDAMLQISWLVTVLHQVTCLTLCLGLSGIAVGLGAVMPSLRETSPSKIAAGFGGTLSLVLSAIYIVLVVLLTALPCHFYFADSQREGVRTWLLGGLGGALLLGLLATWLPMRWGLRAFRTLEM